MRQCMDSENLHRRLKKIIGQVQAIDRMIDEDIPCEDVLAQINAAKSPARTFSPRSTPPSPPCTRSDRSFWKGTSTTVSATASSTATPSRPSPTSPRPSSDLQT